MIVVDMNMPTDCVDCLIDCFPYGAEDTDYSTTNRPNCCPIKCDIEDIKAEIYNLHPITRGNNDYANGAYDGQCWIIDKALAIIANTEQESEERND